LRRIGCGATDYGEVGASCQTQPQLPPGVASESQQRDFSWGAQQVVFSMGAQQALCEIEAAWVRTVATGLDATGPAAVRVAGTPVVATDRNASRESADMDETLSRSCKLGGEQQLHRILPPYR
jgi:hypothetical protein